jgi:hypothetical protein
MFCAALSCGLADGRRRLPCEVALPLLEARLLLSLEPLLRPPDDLLLVRRFDEDVGEEELPFLDPVLFDRERWDFVPLVAIRLTLHPCRTPLSVTRTRLRDPKTLWRAQPAHQAPLRTGAERRTDAASVS